MHVLDLKAHCPVFYQDILPKDPTKCKFIFLNCSKHAGASTNLMSKCLWWWNWR